MCGFIVCSVGETTAGLKLPPELAEDRACRSTIAVEVARANCNDVICRVVMLWIAESA